MIGDATIINKRILMFAPSFFGYFKAIKTELEKQGATVDIVLEDFVNKSILYRFFWVKNQKAKIKYTSSFYKKHIIKSARNYDIVFVIRGEAISEENMLALKKKNPNAVFIMYQWDSVRNNKNCLKIERFFDYIYTFDIEDAKERKWKYRPLFYMNAENIQKVKDIDLTMVGTLYYKRAQLLRKIMDFSLKNKLNVFHYLYSPKIVFIVHRYILRDKRYMGVDYKDVRFVPLKADRLTDVYNCSKILVDYTADDQTGLTMRTIESLGFRCKLITNNKKIMETDIYQFGNIYVYDLDNFNIPQEFIETEYNDLPKELNDYYSLTGWVKSIFSVH